MEWGSVGATAGAKTHTLTFAQLAAHTHGNGLWLYGNGSSTGHGTYYAGGMGNLNSVSTTAAGGDQAHNNIQPTRAALLVIKT